jgi:hypothetical protein
VSGGAPRLRLRVGRDATGGGGARARALLVRVEAGDSALCQRRVRLSRQHTLHRAVVV